MCVVKRRSRSNKDPGTLSFCDETELIQHAPKQCEYITLALIFNYVKWKKICDMRAINTKSAF